MKKEQMQKRLKKREGDSIRAIILMPVGKSVHILTLNHPQNIYLFYE